MISAEEIRRIAREEKLSAGVVEKDYALSWLLNSFYGVEGGLGSFFVLKGGAAIRKAGEQELWR
ncbi:MAG TPA: hypothetical protein ENN36_09570 [Candidatus Bathyarchaeota archaeon]|nr:hypothetical protein [Candidatus Bathyarchaeota archaeon]